MASENTIQDIRLVRLPEVLARTAMGRSWVLKAVKEGRFPAPIALPGSRSVAWVDSEVGEWIAQSIHAARQAQHSNSEPPATV